MNQDPKPTNYRPDIDGLRAVAVLAVLAYHAFPALLPGGFVGVDVFFVISGYLITGIVLGELRRGGFSLRRFYDRRVRRLFPALLPVLACTGLAFGPYLGKQDAAQLGTLVVAGGLSFANIALYFQSGYFDQASELKPLLHLWSLGVEEQFYLVWPLGLAATWRSPAHLKRMLIGGIGVSLALSVFGTRLWPAASFYLPFARIWEPALGGALAYAMGRDAARSALAARPALAHAASALGVALIATALATFTPLQVFPGWRAIVPVAGAVLVVGAGPNAFLNRTLFSRPWAVAIGILSYPLYLWHWPCLVFLRLTSASKPSTVLTLSAVFIAFALAFLTQRYLETPLRFARSPRTTARLLVAMGAVTCLGVAVGCGVLRRAPITEVVAEGLAEHERLTQRLGTKACSSRITHDPRVASICHEAWVAADAPTVVLWGDSHGDAWAPAFVGAARSHGLNAVYFASHGCAPLLGVRTGGQDPAVQCRELGLGEAVMQTIRKLAPARIVLVARWSLYMHGWMSRGVLQPRTPYLTRDAGGPVSLELSQETLRQQLPATVQELATLAPTLVFLNSPSLRLPITVGPALAPTDFEPSLSAHRAETTDSNDIVRRASEGRAVLVDPCDALCALERCPAVLDDIPLYYDDNHVTYQAALRLKPALSRFLERGASSDR
jgi:peptidoglycan/LPS O-acetylase OafA/YrhL